MILISTDYLQLSPVPSAEDCALVGQAGYAERSLKECEIFMRQLERTFPLPESLNGEAWFEIKFFDHDCGAYREVCVVYNMDNREAVDYAYKCEDIPEYWDALAQEELAKLAG